MRPLLVVWLMLGLSLWLSDRAQAWHADQGDVPAIIVGPTAESRRELLRVVRDALRAPASASENSATDSVHDARPTSTPAAGAAAPPPVTLGDDAFTRTNLLAIAHANPRDSAGRLLNGRELQRPEIFALFKRGSRCILVRSNTGDSWALRHTHCKALPHSP